jgi:hypothetical protein
MNSGWREMEGRSYMIEAGIRQQNGTHDWCIDLEWIAVLGRELETCLWEMEGFIVHIQQSASPPLSIPCLYTYTQRKWILLSLEEHK